MEPPFYHVDRRGDLSVGDTLELNWDLEIYRKNESHTLDSQYADQMREDFPRGLSAHGARYIHSFYEINQYPKYYQQNPHTRIPTPISDGENYCVFIENGINEWLAERIRRDSFPNDSSRLQSYFAWPSEGVIEGFGDENYSIFEVEPTGFDLRDMTLLDSVTGMQNYWEGTLTAQPKLEIVMEGPVDIVNTF